MTLNNFRKAERKLYLKCQKLRLKNKNPSIISSNCNGGIISHDLGLRFNTPTINLYFSAKDFLKFVNNLDHYLSVELQDITNANSYPVGQLDDIVIHFLHYHTYLEAQQKWNERKKRINKNNLFIMMTDRDNCSYDDIKEFDLLPYPNKVIFTHKPYNEIESAVYIKGFENNKEVGILSTWKHGLLLRRYLDDFDYVSFLNRK